MPGLLETCLELFETDNLYGVLGVSKEATPNEIKRGYHRQSLKVHPDRVPEKEKEEATKKFQALGKAYSILSEKETRSVYDETGEVDDENDVPQDRDWYEYWRLLYTKISVKDIQEFEEKYKGSDEERSDLASAYVEFEGDMDQIMVNILCARFEDEERFIKILKTLIENKEVPDFKAFSKESKKKKTRRQKRAEEEAAEAEASLKEMRADKSDSLKSLILKKNKSREQEADNFFAQLEAKYAPKPKQKKGKN